MTAQRAVRLTTTITLAVSLTGWGACVASAAVRPADYTMSETGYGSTLGLAEQNAEAQLRGDCTIKGGFHLGEDGQYADGSWWALMSATCGTPR